MITWTIGGAGGPIASGIPSEDVGLSILRDMCYPDADQEDEVLTVRREMYEDRDSDEEFWVAVDDVGRQRLVLSSEERCDHCGQARDFYYGYRGI